MIKKISALFLLFLLIGCSSARERSVNGFDGNKSATITSEDEKSAVSEKERIIIYNAWFSIDTGDRDKTARDIAALAPKFGGYVVSTGTSEAVIRVLSEKFEEAIAAVEKCGDVTSKKIYSEDVTESYRDTEIRLESKLKARERYLDLLKKAGDVSSALSVERELERINGEIEQMKGRIKRLSHLSRFSTITVSIEEEVKPGPLGYLFIGAWKVVKWLFIRN